MQHYLMIVPVAGHTGDDAPIAALELRHVLVELEFLPPDIEDSFSRKCYQHVYIRHIHADTILAQSIIHRLHLYSDGIARAIYFINQMNGPIEERDDHTTEVQRTRNGR